MIWYIPRRSRVYHGTATRCREHLDPALRASVAVFFLAVHYEIEISHDSEQEIPSQLVRVMMPY